MSWHSEPSTVDIVVLGDGQLIPMMRAVSLELVPMMRAVYPELVPMLSAVYLDLVPMMNAVSTWSWSPK